MKQLRNDLPRDIVIQSSAQRLRNIGELRESLRRVSLGVFQHRLERFPNVVLPFGVAGQAVCVEHALDGLRKRAPGWIVDVEAVLLRVGDVVWVLGVGGRVGLVGRVEPGPFWRE